MTLSRKDLWVALGLLAALFICFSDVFLARSAPLVGDHYEQHFPWAQFLAESLKKGGVPLWTNALQCGFPIAAEGQISIYYLPQLILYFLLPIHWGYAYLLLTHLFISGYMTYLYCRSAGLERTGAAMAGAVFLFGAGIGGAYYNITSLKTICWLPAMLFGFELFLKSAKKRYLIGISMAAAFSILAGYLQVAFYTLCFFILYGFLRIFIFTDRHRSWLEKASITASMALALMGSVALSFPQLYLTFQASMLSNRLGLTEEYAYIGPISPAAFLTFIFPSLQPVVRANCFYLGIPALVFLIAAFREKETRQAAFFKIWLSITGIALLLSLGKWGGLYPALIKLTHFYSFRIPSKFIVFCCLGLAMLCGIGFQRLFARSSEDSFRTFLTSLRRPFHWIAGGLLAVYGAGYLFITLGRDFAVRAGEWLIERYIHGQAGHPHSMEVYRENLRSFLDTVAYFASPLFFWNILALTLLGFTYFIFFIQKKWPMKRIMIISMLVLAVDLGFYSVWDLRADFDSYAHAFRANPVAEKLKEEARLEKVGRIHGLRPIGKNLPVIPSANMNWGLEQIGVYSPLVSARYHESIGLLGDVNDSNFRYTPETQYVLERLPLLNFLNVSHVLSAAPLNHPALKLIQSEPEFQSSLYENTLPHGLAHFTGRLEVFPDWAGVKEKLMSAAFDPAQTLLLEKSEADAAGMSPGSLNPSAKAALRLIRRADESSEWEADTDGAGFFMLSEIDFPGWQVLVNEKPAIILKAHGLFRAVWLPGAGKYRIQFFYRPFSGNRHD